MKLDWDDAAFHYVLVGIGIFAGSLLKSAAELADKWIVQKLKSLFR